MQDTNHNAFPSHRDKGNISLFSSVCAYVYKIINSHCIIIYIYYPLSKKSECIEYILL